MWALFDRLARPFVGLALAVISDFWRLVPRPTDASRVVTPGGSPLHLLLIGSGAAVGYGVLTHELAMPGHLARRLTATTRRGTVVDIVAHGDMTGVGYLEALRTVALSKFDVIVATIGVNEALSVSPIGAWQKNFARIISHINGTASERAQTFFVGVPPIPAIGSYPWILRRIWGRRARMVNAVMAAACARHDRITFVEFAPPNASDADRHRSPDTYRLWAELLVEPIRRTLSSAEPGSDPGPHRERRSPERS